jgi:hypothetical protein
VVAFNGCKAVVETNVVIIGENLKLGLGCAGHSRFYDLVEKRGGVWEIVKRQCIYDMGSFTFPIGIVDIDKAIVARYPSAAAGGAYGLLFVGGLQLISAAAPVHHRGGILSALYLLGLSVNGRAGPRAATTRGLSLAVDLGAAAIILMNLATLVLARTTRFSPKP